MIKEIKNLPNGILGFTYSGKVTGKDYDKVIFPVIRIAAKQSK